MAEATLQVLVTTNTAGLITGLELAKAATKEAGDKIGDAGRNALSGWTAGLSRILELIVSVVAAVGALSGVGFGGFEALNELKNIAEIGKLSKLVGESVENMSALSFAFKRAGIDEEAFAQTTKHLREQIGEAAKGSKEARESISAFGIDADKLSKMPFSEQLEVIAEKYSKLTDPAEKAALAHKLLGKQWQELDPILAKGGKGLQDLMEQARATGNTFGSETVQQYKNYKVAVQELQAIMTGLYRQIAVALVPALSSLGDFIKAAIKYAGEFIDYWKPVFIQVKDIVVFVFNDCVKFAQHFWDMLKDGSEKAAALLGDRIPNAVQKISWMFNHVREAITIALAVIEVLMERWLTITVAAATAVLNVMKATLDKVNQAAKQTALSIASSGLSNLVTDAVDWSELGTIAGDEFTKAFATPMDLIMERIKLRLAALNLPKIKPEEHGLPNADQTNIGPHLGPVAAVTRGSVAAQSAIFSAQNNLKKEELSELKKANGHLGQIAAHVGNAGGGVKVKQGKF